MLDVYLCCSFFNIYPNLFTKSRLDGKLDCVTVIQNSKQQTHPDFIRKKQKWQEMKSRKVQSMYITEVRSGAAERYTSSEWWLVYPLNWRLNFTFQKIASKT